MQRFNIESCIDSTACVLETTFSAAVPLLVLSVVALRVVGARAPDIAIFKEFITQDDVSAAVAEDAASQNKPRPHSVTDPSIPTEDTPLLLGRDLSGTRLDTWRQVTLTLIALFQVAIWTTNIVLHAKGFGNLAGLDLFGIATSAVTLLSWAYAVLRPNIRPSHTPYYDLFVIYVSHLLAACVGVYDLLNNTSGSFRLGFGHCACLFNVLMSLAGVIVIVNMPLSVVRDLEVDETNKPVTLEDHCTLWQWITFSWVSPVISLGARRPLEEKDIWKLSYTMRTRVVMRKFLQLRHASLLRRLFVANALDIFIDITFTFLSTLMNFSGPFFLNLILRAMSAESSVSSPSGHFYTATLSDNWHFYSSAILDSAALPSLLHQPLEPITTASTRATRTLQRSDAYFFAVLLCICQLIKSQSDLQHLYFSRRATIRIDGELVASVYEKILRHKDVSGVTQSKKDSKGKGNEAQAGPPQPPSSGDAGRIISLISLDAHRLSITFSQGPYVYDALISVFIASIMLYNLMGWTAFTGYLALLLILPLNTLNIKRATGLHRAEAAMRDRRMQAMNEVVQAIKLIKFSAWESRWVTRVLGVRQEELKWLRKLKISYLFSSILWNTVPILVSAISFSCFTLVAKRDLTVDIAFPCIAILGMLSTSLTALPMIISWAVQCLTALGRIEDYLSEEDVPDYVSSLKRSTVPPHAPVDTRIGCTDATFRWPSASSKDQDAKKVQSKSGGAAEPVSAWRSAMRIPAWLVRSKKRVVEESSTGEQEVTGSENALPFTLKDMTMLFPEGKISLVCGPTGSGKSASLAALLGEMDCLAGEVFLPKEPTRLNEKTGLPLAISYCAQQPWLEHKSIKDNILFGSPFDQARYEATLRCCALLPDLAVFEDGDNTEIGEKGVSLSGGQKARVALARAVYARTQVVLMDDVLSAVDSHTAEEIVNKCFLGPLMKHRTIVLVTHHVDLVLPIITWVVKLHDGRIQTQGTVAQLRESGVLSMARAGEEAYTPDDPTSNAGEDTEAKPSNDPVNKLVEQEEKSTGMVKAQVYKTYLSASSYWLFSILIMCLAADQLMQLAEKLWIKYWSESYQKTDTAPVVASKWIDLPSASRDVLPYLLVYIGIEGAISSIGLLSQIPRIMSSLRASRVLFEGMLRSVMRSPSRFFDKTPSGRILNRFSKDIDAIDGGIQDFMTQVIKQVVALAVAVGTIVYVIPLFVIPAIAIACLHLWLAYGYVNASRDLRRIESNSRSPVTSSFSELVMGISTVRAFGSERMFLNTLYERLDRTLAASHYFWMCNRWLVFRFDTLGALSILLATIGSLMAGASAGLAGVVIVQAQQYVRGLYWSIRFWTDLEQSFNSVERIQEYLSLPPEPPGVIQSSRPSASWPSAAEGTLTVKNLVIKYSPELEPALNGVSFEAKPSEKIGIVGRTGSGKSTLALALFRFVDPTAGSIMLDGIDITSISVEDLRSRLSLIAQDVVLFKGTIRENLDPFDDYTDAECVQALQRVHLRTAELPENSASTSQIASTVDNAAQSREVIGEYASSSGGSDTLTPTEAGILGESGSIFTLETKVSEGGNNFSHGQRQLLSMARALLRKSSVIVMDESTASVDFEADAKIQATIRAEFSQSILLTIAHRLRTIIDNDRILVLSTGRVVEFDTPWNLLKKPNGTFREMCKRSGDYHELLRMARRKFEGDVLT